MLEVFTGPLVFVGDWYFLVDVWDILLLSTIKSVWKSTVGGLSVFQ